MSSGDQRAPIAPLSGRFSDLSLEELRQLQNQFCSERDWEQYHTPRNVMLALVGEVGELAEIFQWKGEVSPGVPELTPEEKTHLGEELSDVLLYLVRLAERCQVDLSREVLRKLEKNARKYPIEKVKGKSEKYTEYAEIDMRKNKADSSLQTSSQERADPSTKQ